MSVAAAVFLGVTSSAAWDSLKTVWSRLSGKTWQQLYLQSFQEALNDYQAELVAKGRFDVDVQLDSIRLTEVFQYDLGSLDDRSISAVTADAFVQRLALVLQNREVLVIPGHNLHTEDYAQIVRNFSQKVRAVFKQVVLKDEDAFKHIIFDVAQQVDSSQLVLAEVAEGLKTFSDASNEYFQEILEQLKKFSVPEHLQIGLVAPQCSDEELKKAFSQTGGVLRRYPKEIAGVHLQRTEVEKILNWLRSESSEQLGMVLDQPGSGKSVVMCQVQEALETDGALVLTIKADTLSGISSQSMLTEQLYLPGDPVTCVKQLAATAPVVVLIDQLDALSLTFARDNTLLTIILNLVFQLRDVPNVKILASCRSFDLNFDQRLSRLAIDQTFSVGLLTETQVKHVLERLEVDATRLLPGHFALLKVPQNLAVYAKLVQNGDASRLEPFQNIQGLYDALWRAQITSPEPNHISSKDRVDAVYKLVKAMQNRRQPQLTAPESVLDDYPDVANYLLAVGFIRREGQNYLFSHQTLFDYCFARQFIAIGQSVSQAILSSPQGLFERSQMVQLYAYLRGTDTALYLRELRAGLFSPNLRPHLRYLLIELFANLEAPTQDEIRLARKLIYADSDTLKRFIFAAASSSMWFSWLSDEVIPKLLASDDEQQTQIALSYLEALVETRTDTVVSLLEPYLGRSDVWDAAIYACLSRVTDWQHDKALGILTDLIARDKIDGRGWGFHFFKSLVETNPVGGCRILRIYLDNKLAEHIETRLEDEDDEVSTGISERWADKIFASLHLHNELIELQRSTPDAFLDELLPWFVMALKASTTSAHNDEAYPYDFVFDSFLYNDDTSETHQFVSALTQALSQAASATPEKFRSAVTKLRDIESVAAHRMILKSYLMNPQRYVEDMFVYLLADVRRWKIGYSDAGYYDSARLFQAVFEHADPSKRLELEAFLLNFRPTWERNDLKSRGYSQLPFWCSVPSALLSDVARRRRFELKRKFPDVQLTPHGLYGGFVDSPVPEQALQKMTDKQWLGAMRRYDDTTGWDEPRREFLKGGIVELSRALQARVKEEPDRFYKLALRFDASIPSAYIEATISGLVDSVASSTRIFELVRHFKARMTPEIRRMVCWALEKRAEDGMPDDLIDLVSDWALTDADPDRELWSIENVNYYGGDPFGHGINTTRGAAVRCASRCAMLREPPQRERTITLLEQASHDPSTAVRATIIEALSLLLNEDQDYLLQFFGQLITDHERLLENRVSLDFLLRISLTHFKQCRPYFEQLLESSDSDVRLTAARGVCLAALSGKTDQTLIAKVMEGDEKTRLGAAQVFARNFSDSKHETVCKTYLLPLLSDPEPEVKRAAGEVFRYLDDRHFDRLQPFLESFVESPAFEQNPYNFIQYFLPNTVEAPDLALRTAERILQSESGPEGVRNPQRGLAERELVQLVLAVYVQSDSPEHQASAISYFEELLGRRDYKAIEALKQWDRR